MAAAGPDQETACGRTNNLKRDDDLAQRGGCWRSSIDRHKTPRTICRGGKGTAHASITCHLACHNFVAGFRVEYGNSGTGMHRGAFSLRRKRTSPRPSPRASKCRAGLASHPGRVTWGKGCRQYVSGQQSDSLQTRAWQRALALFRPRWSVPCHLKNTRPFTLSGWPGDDRYPLGLAAGARADHCQGGLETRSRPREILFRSQKRGF